MEVGIVEKMSHTGEESCVYYMRQLALHAMFASVGVDKHVLGAILTELLCRQLIPRQAPGRPCWSRANPQPLSS